MAGRTNFLIVLVVVSLQVSAQDSLLRYSSRPDSIATHAVRLDSGGSLLSWITPQNRSLDSMLRLRWNFILDRVPSSPGPAPRSDYPMYYFFCGYKDQKMIPDSWMNDVGEKIPNWYESARLYYQYSGDERPLKLVARLASYAIEHGTSPASFAWPHFPYTTTNAGDTVFHGFTDAKRFVLHEVQVDHAADMGLAYYGLYLSTGDKQFKTAAIHIADDLASHARTGTAKESVWPYRVVMSDGRVTAPYGANWFPAYQLLERLANAGEKNAGRYRAAAAKARSFLLSFPMRTRFWADGHTDTDVRSDTYKSNMSASNAKLYLLQHPEFDSAWKKDVPALIRWTEDNFVFRCAPGEPATQWSANLVGEQDEFLPKMDYQTARYGAECAAWYHVSGDTTFREKAFRSLNWVTYCTDEKGLVFESPVSKGISSWWSDCYGEGPRMIYMALAAIPEWAPENENHILYSESALTDVSYGERSVRYNSSVKEGKEFIKLSFRPTRIELNHLPLRSGLLSGNAYQMRQTGDGGYLLVISHRTGGSISIEK